MTPAEAYAAMGDFPAHGQLSDAETEAYIKREICLAFGVTESRLMGRKRDQHVAFARQVAIWATRKWTSYSYPVIGRLYNRDHSTTIHAYHVIERRMVDRHFAQYVNGLLAGVEYGR
jgi:chromosomal replication initiation ATPase DnaA